MIYQASCHCGNVRFKAEGEIASVTACNCSMCQRKGALMWFVPRSALHLLTPEHNAGTYVFNQHKIKHRFCPRCGIAPYSEAQAPSGEAMAAINVRCIEGIALETIAVNHYDGRAL